MEFSAGEYALPLTVWLFRLRLPPHPTIGMNAVARPGSSRDLRIPLHAQHQRRRRPLVRLLRGCRVQKLGQPDRKRGRLRPRQLRPIRCQ